MKMVRQKNIVYSVILVAVVALGSCKKTDPQQQTTATQPVFTFSGNINGAPVTLQAGVNNYYMYTSYTQDANNVYNFIGDLKPYNCTNCTNSLKIQINDYQPLAVGAPANIGVSLSPGYYALEVPGGTPTSISVPITSTAMNGTPQSWLWNFGDGTSSTVQNPTHTFTRPGNYTVSLATTFTNLVVDSIRNVISVGTPEAGMIGAFGSYATANTVTVSSSVSGNPPYVFQWDFGDGSTANTQPNAIHTYSASGVYTVRMHVTDTSNHVLDFIAHCPTQTYTSPLAGFYGNYPGPQTNPTSLSNVTISWTDGNGVVYTSKDAQQPATSYFRVLSVDPYSNNSNGQPTKKIHALAKCTLYNGTSSMTLDNADIVFAVAYH